MRFQQLFFLGLILFLMGGCDQPLTFDKHGLAHGTGEKTYTYPSGAIKLREEYVRGQPVRSRWFKPDGTLIQETKWNNGNGEVLYLRDDGSIRARMQYRNGVAEGDATEYDQNGNLVKVERYHAGQPARQIPSTVTQPVP